MSVSNILARVLAISGSATESAGGSMVVDSDVSAKDPDDMLTAFGCIDSQQVDFVYFQHVAAV